MRTAVAPAVVRRLTLENHGAVLFVVVGGTCYRKGSDNASVWKRCPGEFPEADIPLYKMALENPPSRIVKGNPPKSYRVVVVRLTEQEAKPGKAKKLAAAGKHSKPNKTHRGRVIRSSDPFRG